MACLRKVLVVDDEPRIRSLFSRRLSEEGFAVVASEDGEEALDIIRKNEDIDLVVLDIVLPQSSGLDVFDAIRKEFPQLRIIVSSVYPRDEQEFMIWDADDYYYKTDNLSKLVDKINKMFQWGAVR